jgi:hypothetical protein
LLEFDLGGEHAFHGRGEVFVGEVVALIEHEAVDSFLEFVGGLVAISGAAGEGFEDDVFEFLGDVGIEEGGGADLNFADFFEGGEITGAEKEAFEGEEFVEDDAEGEDIAATVELATADLLGAHVAEFSFQDTYLSGARFPMGLRDAEVDQLDLAFVAYQNILRAYVAVDDAQFLTLLVALVVRIVKPLTETHYEVTNHRNAKFFIKFNGVIVDRLQVAPRHILKGNKIAFIDLTEIKNLSDVGVVKLNRDLGLIDKHVNKFFILRDRREDSLDRDEALETLNTKRLGFEDLSHAARVDLFKQIILTERNRFLENAQIAHEPRLLF